jgi:hypothetical protein
LIVNTRQLKDLHINYFIGKQKTGEIGRPEKLKLSQFSRKATTIQNNNDVATDLLGIQMQFFEKNWQSTTIVK